LVLVHLLLTTCAALADGTPGVVGWALALVGLTAAVYVRAVLAVGLSWRRVGLLLAAPLVVVRLAGLIVAGLVRRRPTGWEGAPPVGADRSEPVPRPVMGRIETRFARRPARVMRLLHGPFVHSRQRRSPFVALTFDDGPHPVHTPEVLDRLRRYGVTATFFLVGERAGAAPHIVHRIAAAGHALGNHTLSHPRFGLLSLSAPRRELERCQELLPDARVFRPPFGRLTPGVWLAARRLGLPVVTWSVDSGDWQCASEAEALSCARTVLGAVRPGDIVLLHDDRPWIGAILDVLLPGLAARGLLDPTAGAPDPRRRSPVRQSSGRAVRTAS
jgi:peptidoglycan/xylan/chitin deacetylase (PgdA/CDA1 family)